MQGYSKIMRKIISHPKTEQSPEKTLESLSPNEEYAMMSDPDFTITKLF